MGNYFSNEDKKSHKLKSNLVCEYKCSKDKSVQYIEITSRALKEELKNT